MQAFIKNNPNEWSDTIGFPIEPIVVIARTDIEANEVLREMSGSRAYDALRDECLDAGGWDVIRPATKEELFNAIAELLNSGCSWYGGNA